MDECEVCGRKSDELYQVNIEGAEMIVCASCAHGKAILQEFSNKKEPEQKIFKREKKEELSIIDNFGIVVRRAREALGLPQKVLAERINERESTLVRLEKGEHLPDDKLARKLEKELNVKLIVNEARDGKRYTASKQDQVTFGDSVVVKDRRDKGN